MDDDIEMDRDKMAEIKNYLRSQYENSAGKDYDSYIQNVESTTK